MILEFLDSFYRENYGGLLFTILGLGYALGKISMGGFQLGSVAGVLFVGLLFGHLGYVPSQDSQMIGFVLFIFCVGVQAGPGFFSVMKQDGRKYFVLSIFLAVIGFATAVALSKLFGFEAGSSAGLLAGGMTSSPTLAAAQEAIRTGQVAVPEGFTAEEVMTNISTGYAITYIFGLVGLILMLRAIPKIVGVDMVAEAKKLEAAAGSGLEDRTVGVSELTSRVFKVEKETAVGMTIRDLYDRYQGRASFERIRRDGEILPATDDTVIQLGDAVCVVGRLSDFVENRGTFGSEIVDDELAESSIESGRVVALRSKTRETTVSSSEIVRRSGCFLSRIQRMGVDLPLGETITVRPGDVLHVTGPAKRLEELGVRVGHVEQPSEETDLITFAIGIAFGLLVGTLTVKIGGVSIGLGTAGGLLAAGLLIGYLRALHPTFGRVPSGARWILTELGLMVFMAGVGLRAGADILETLQQSGLGLIVAGMILTATPVVTGWLFGSKVLGINPVLLLGGITGAMTSGASLSVVTSTAKSSVPALGYTGCYAFSNILLTIAGSLILLF